jgi:putative FmdB family regulatory protein
MATYGYRCAYCGPFETRANPRSAGSPAPCPSCGELSPRSYSAPGGRSPRRARQLDGVGAAGRTRIDRAEEGVPAVGPRPSGGGVPFRGRPAAGADAGHHRGARPWQVRH